MSSSLAADRVPPAWWREHSALLVQLGALTVLSWIYLGYLARTMRTPTLGMPGMVMPGTGFTHPAVWRGVDVASDAVMWSVMMAAMMLPSVTPTVLLFARVRRAAVRLGRVVAPPAVFVAGYSVVWLTFSVSAALVQGMLANALVLSPNLRLAPAPLSALLLGAAGVYQLTPLKRACLARCRSPLVFLQTHWHDDAAGVFAMGARYGIACLGCCSALMLLLFVGGVMNLAWVGLLASVVLVEKILPIGAAARPWIGAVLLFSAVALIAHYLTPFA